MLIDNLLKGFPSHTIKDVKNDLNDLISRNIVVKKPTSHGYAVYINLEYKDVVFKRLKQENPFLRGNIWSIWM